MKKIMLLLCCSLIPWIARGQAAYDWYYWFDSDDAVKTEGNSIGNSFSIITDANGLSQGFHTIHVQVVDTAGVYSPPKTEYFYHTTDRSVVALRYWFDNDMEHMQKVSASGSNYTVDVSSLEPGLHYIYCQIEDASGSVSDVVRSGFYRQIRPTAMTWTYWFDETESTKATVKYPGEAVMVDVSDLTDGFHTIHSQVQEITPSSVETRMFIKTPQTEGVGNMTCICTIDGNLVAQEEVPAQGGIMRWEMNVDSLDVGIHKAMFQAITPSGAASSIAERYFVRAITNKELGSMKCVYSLDNFKTSAQAGTLSNGLFHFDLDVSAMEDGLHRLAYMLVSENGVTTPQKTAFFWKTPLGGSGITQYDYWLNESKNVHSVTLDKRTNPFSLVKLLPVETEPIRSSCFQFEVKDGKPMLYAKNDFHIAFYDVTGRRVDESKQYVDYNVKQEVADITELLPTQTFERPDSNCVKWFKFEAEYGDSIALKSNQATSIQVFSASGKELYATSGSSSVKIGGCHVFDDGTYYVAVHDVTGSSSELTLHSQRIDKYSIFEYTPDVISDEGIATFTFTGNGFEYVKSIELTDGSTTLTSDSLFSNGRQMIASFDLDTNRLVPSVYTLRVYFHDEDRNDSKVLTLKDAVTIEPAQVGDIAVNVVRENRVGDPYPVQVHIKNTGNVAYWGIPLGIAFDGITRFDALTFENFKYYISEEEYNKKDFFAYSDNLLGTGKNGLYFPMLLPYIGPYEEITYVIGIKTKIAHANINIYAWTGEPWSESLKEDNSSSSMRKVNMKAPSCQPTNLPLIHDLLGAFGNLARPLQLPTAIGQLSIGTGEAIGGMIQGATRAREDAIFDAYGIPPEDRDDYRFHYRYCPRSPSDIAMSFAPNGNPLHIQRKAPMKARTIAENASSNCPQVPPVPVNPWIPGDPNEITGYLSESGSHYINAEVVNVGYDIEFENDPEIANAAAHHIVIRDTLDARSFDFESFSPKTVKISGKEVELDGTYPFIKSLDMRPAINSIAELRGDFDKKKGIATWDLIALDPMTMEPTDDIMQGILPVNTQDGNGIGNVTYTINLKSNLGDGTEIPNHAGIIFDYNDPIQTPTWTNIIDAVPPTSDVCNLELINDTIVRVHFEGEDKRSGIWKYQLFVQYGENASWNEVVETDTTCYDFRYYEDINYGFCVLAIDSAGNVEKKVIEREFFLHNGEIAKEDAIVSPRGNEPATISRAYDLQGRIVQEKGYRGVLIKNRRKTLRR